MLAIKVFSWICYGVGALGLLVGSSKFAVSRITRNPEAARERLYLWEDRKNNP